MEVTNLLQSLSPDVVAIQETKLSEASRTPRFAGYSGHHGLGANVGGARGAEVSLYVRDDVTVQRTRVGDTANCVFRRIVNPSKSVIVGCVYVP